jgi:hypothetical protein
MRIMFVMLGDRRLNKVFMAFSRMQTCHLKPMRLRRLSDAGSSCATGVNAGAAQDKVRARSMAPGPRRDDIFDDEISRCCEAAAEL